MKFKLIIQLVVCILLGYVAKAGEIRWDKQPLSCDNPCCYNSVRTQSVLNAQDEPVSFTAQAPQNKQLKCRTRLRAAASLSVSAAPVSEVSRSFEHSGLAEPLQGSNKHRILPFYYIFLFRFTPF